MIRIGKICLAIIATTFAPSLAFAHPSLHHADSLTAGLVHPLGGSDHLLAMVGVGLWAAQLGGRALWMLPLAFMSALMAGGTVGMLGVPALFVEPGILGSLLAIGLAVALAWRVHAAAGFALVAAFAFFHGHAHGSEMPEGASTLTYASGFLFATGLLHLAGIVIGFGNRYLGRPMLTRVAGAAISVTGMILMLT
ncbi:HupE/UreJ family protein [Microvirga massiliensis]|uniref:HupE/UreJ family protein n=1 Tax=Microvirga massiliensis TaxID=1033741 RepID=UPI00062BDD48|nr:HupE/UreJ family protein [Microvirga massiliensis]